MLLYLIRHGHPDYSTDTLTPIGVEQAKALVPRMLKETPLTLYSSKLGRAQQTAQPLAEALSQEVTILPFMHELSWSKGHSPWDSAQAMVHAGRPVGPDWASDPEFIENLVTEDVASRQLAFDEFLATKGYERTKDGFYRVVAPSDERIAIFCHAGVTGALLAHLLKIPLPAACIQFHIYFTSVTAVSFSTEENRLCLPCLQRVGDCSHLGPIAETV